MKWNIPIPYSPFYKFLLLQSRGRGALVIVPLAMPVPVVAARICERGHKRGKRSDRAGGGCGSFPPPTVGRFFENSCMKNGIFLHIKYPLLGIVYVVAQTDSLSLFLFLLNLSQGNIFFFLFHPFFFVFLFFFFFFFFLLADQQGGLVPPPPLATPVPRAKARERNDRARGGCRGDFWKFVYENSIFLHIKCHY